MNFLQKFFKKQKKTESSPYNKVFGIGYPKTGSTSLAVALRQLGLNTLHDESCVFPKALMVGDILTCETSFDACVNINQWLFKKFDELYPNSKFILTTRNEESWWWSIKWWRDLGQIQAFDRYIINDVPYIIKSLPQLKSIEELFGYFALFKCFGQNKELYIESYKQHNQNVLEYFKDKPNQLLVLPLESENKNEILAEFLNKVPQTQYPHEKQTHNQYIN